VLLDHGWRELFETVSEIGAARRPAGRCPKVLRQSIEIGAVTQEAAPGDGIELFASAYRFIAR
jgi:hypothetical protein